MELLNRHSAAGFLGAESGFQLADSYQHIAWQQQRSKLVVQRDIGGLEETLHIRVPGVPVQALSGPRQHQVVSDQRCATVRR